MWPNVFVVRKRGDVRMVRCVIVSKDPLFPLKIRVRIVDAHRVTQLSADDFIEVQERVVPEKSTASNDAVVVVRGQEGEWLLQVAYQRVLAQR